jgi:predicted Ser/Thr protein kinase
MFGLKINYGPWHYLCWVALILCLLHNIVAQDLVSRSATLSLSPEDCSFKFETPEGSRPQWTTALGNFAAVEFNSGFALMSMPMYCLLRVPAADGELTTGMTIVLNRFGDKDLKANVDVVRYAVISNSTGSWVVNARVTSDDQFDMTQDEVTYTFDGVNFTNAPTMDLALIYSVDNSATQNPSNVVLRSITATITYLTNTTNLTPEGGGTPPTDNVPLIVGLSVSLPIAAAGAVVLIILLLRRNKNKKGGGSGHKKDKPNDDVPLQSTQANRSTPTIYTGVDVIGSNATSNPSFQALSPNNQTVNLDNRFAIPWSRLVFKQEIGSGAFGKVYLGTWQSTQVAIKVSNSIGATEEFQKEARIMVNIRPHPNVLQVLGVSTDGQAPAIILEYCPGRSLDETLFNKSKKITAAYQNRLIFGIAKGLLHLHLNNIVHRDLAARNILLSGDGEAKISDFGMSRIVESTIQEGTTKTNIGPIRWMAPEAIRNRKYSTKSDVWSFGVVMTEILNREQPFNEFQDVLEVALELKSNKTPKVPTDCNEVYKNIINMCFQADPNARPEMEKICNMLEQYRP